MRYIGVIVALLGLILAGMSGTRGRVRRNAPRPKNWKLWTGLALILIGALLAIFATQVSLVMGWQTPG